MTQIPVSAVIPTIGRKDRLLSTLESLAGQSMTPKEVIIVDGAEQERQIGEDFLVAGLNITVLQATERGAGTQRNQGLLKAAEPFILFMDDDIDLGPGCVESLWQEMNSNENLGGCNAVITNQSYQAPGRIMRILLSLVGCPNAGSLAGQCCGPSLNFLPELKKDASSASVQWLNTTCTLYRRSALPTPVFLSFFQGYSLLEDAALSLEVGKKWNLSSVSNAKIFHDSQPADYKSQTRRRSQMEWTNRWFVMNRIEGKRGLLWNSRLAIFQFLMLGLSLRGDGGIKLFVPRMLGLFDAALTILRSGKWCGYPK